MSTKASFDSSGGMPPSPSSGQQANDSAASLQSNPRVNVVSSRSLSKPDPANGCGDSDVVPNRPPVIDAPPASGEPGNPAITASVDATAYTFEDVYLGYELDILPNKQPRELPTDLSSVWA
ncbi:hypothetical protein EXIGLDRAFT_841922 [Exidia glandulosa HHB12029]|uniref:Uncharacterized protein n=1 Tax=Exidia glandulosa HHB12029 TaxID=1314781 RepID=A0A165DL25_EXIGL|nr:hypothetical protein EXIGLDRAFT_841922 [Exidia glandulosa HHB12029]